MTKHYKNEAGEIWGYDFEADVPEGMVELMQDELAALFARPEDNPQIRAQADIDTLERQHMLPRVVRESLLQIAEKEAIEFGAKQGLTSQQSLVALAQQNVGYARVKALDAQITALRAIVNG